MKISNLLVAISLAVSMPIAYSANKEDFNVQTTRGLVNLCSAESGEDLYEAAMGFCLGFVDAAHDYHAVVTSGDMLPPVACPGHKTTRQEVVDMFLEWAKANDAMLDKESPIQGLMRAAADKWPCEASA